MTELDSDYLKETIGDVLSSAIADTVLHQPADPIEAIGLFLLHHVKNQTRVQQDRLIAEEADKRIQRYEAQKSKREAAIRQAEEARKERQNKEQEILVSKRVSLYEAYLEREQENDDLIAKEIADNTAAVDAYLSEVKAREERALAKQKAEEEKKAREEEEGEENEEEEEGNEEEKEEEDEEKDEEDKKADDEEKDGEEKTGEEQAEEEEEQPLEVVEPLDPLTVWQKTYEYRVEDVLKTDQQYFNEMQKMEPLPEVLVQVLRGTFHMLGRPTKDLDSPEKLKKLIDFNLAKKCALIHPEETDTDDSGKIRYKMSARAIASIDPDEVVKAGYGGIILYKWLCAALDLRLMGCFRRKELRLAEKSSEEEEQEEEEPKEAPEEEEEEEPEAVLGEEHGIEEGPKGMRAWHFEEEKRQIEEEKRQRKLAAQAEEEEGEEEAEDGEGEEGEGEAEGEEGEEA
ncbi:hypothetical protein BLNAU_18642 [Blattamonas nauphoetae]|uniref:Uncharacterized protein n=1 Tax=Blattamonas nauphoetae TaxID=2049346 RepID=A0ABQ9X6Y8_9EUKA|nr:hypothetical protein BLNAU_18642 [Blattamonas nauphoetae]